MKTTSRKSLPACIALMGALLGGSAGGEEVRSSDSLRRVDSAMVLLWSSEATNTIVTVGGVFACRAAVYKGIVHSAIYDAVVGIEGGY